MDPSDPHQVRQVRLAGQRPVDMDIPAGQGGLQPSGRWGRLPLPQPGDCHRMSGDVGAGELFENLQPISGCPAGGQLTRVGPPVAPA